MSMYNMVMGLNPMAPLVTHTLGIKPNGTLDAGRIRDAGLIEVDGEIRFELLTRNGKDAWIDDAETPNNALRAHSLYLRDYDDSLDETYKIFEFKVPEDDKESVRGVWDKIHEFWKRPAMQRYWDRIEDIKKNPVLAEELANHLDKHVDIVVLSPEEDPKPQ